MKTPREVVEQFMPKEIEVLNIYRSALENWVGNIQRDAFESGRLMGLWEASEMILQSDENKEQTMVRIQEKVRDIPHEHEWEEMPQILENQHKTFRCKVCGGIYIQTPPPPTPPDNQKGGL